MTHVAREMGMSRATGYKWWRQFRDEGIDGGWTARADPIGVLIGTGPDLEAQIAELRDEVKLGPTGIGYRLGVASSTVHRVLVRLGLNRLAWMDRPTGRIIRRYERGRPGELVHVDIKKLGKIPDGGGGRCSGARLATGQTPNRSSQQPDWVLRLGSNNSLGRGNTARALQGVSPVLATMERGKFGLNSW